jgi:hypothetical protein
LCQGKENNKVLYVFPRKERRLGHLIEILK